MRIMLVKTDLPCALGREWCKVEVVYFAGCTSVFAVFSVSTFIFP